ncbi:MAG: hypothetical protein MN733_03440 [Nitrososphaera sp.]|nr:hypothetical protein [Nitrososphaera sp.]
MPTVVNKAEPGTPLDKPLTKHNRTNAGDPNGSLTPQYSGEIVLDTTNKKLWQAQTLLNTDWVTFNVGPYVP